MPLVLGVIADDLTGATDVADGLDRAGLATAVVVGPEPVPAGVDAAVVALKSRSVPPDAAVAASLRALAVLEEAGAGRIYFKYCSTFDSTARGNIGPVAEALAARLGERAIVYCPAFPETGRTVRDGTLYVHGVPLADTPMRDHPLNPMRDSRLAHLLRPQVGGPITTLGLAQLRGGHASTTLEAARRSGARHVIADAETATDLDALANALVEARLTTGATGLAAAIARAAARDARPSSEPIALPGGPTAVLAGSCSTRTLEQLAYAQPRVPCLRVDVREICAGTTRAADAVRWAVPRLGALPVVVATSADAATRRVAESSADAARLGQAAEDFLAECARLLRDGGVRRFVLAGGETAGAALGALAVRSLRVARALDPGVPVMRTDGPDPLALVLKSGNFGRPALFVEGFGT